MDLLLLLLAITLLVGTIAAGWALTLLGLPGNWLILAATAAYAWLAPTSGVTQISWSTLLVMTVLAVGGEIAELVAGVWGARVAGGSRRAAIFSLLGSMVGAVLGASFGLPLPLIGPPIAALLGGALGALAGAALAERTRGETSRQSLRVGSAAFVGRLLGSGIKTLVATLLAILAIGALIL